MPSARTIHYYNLLSQAALPHALARGDQRVARELRCGTFPFEELATEGFLGDCGTRGGSPRPKAAMIIY